MGLEELRRVLVCTYVHALPTSIVPDGEVAAVGSLRSQAEEELVSCGGLVSIDGAHRLDFLLKQRGHEGAARGRSHQDRLMDTLTGRTNVFLCCLCPILKD